MIKQSKNINVNYAAKVCRIDAIEPIPKADKIVRAIIGNDRAVVSKDMKVGDIVIFFPCESALHPDYLRINNLYDIASLNDNYQDYLLIESKLKDLRGVGQGESLKAKMIEDELKHMKGFFNRTGRVRMLKLRGEYSLGFITPVSTLEAAWPKLKSLIWSKHIGEQFDMVGDTVICWKYVPVYKESPKQTRGRKGPNMKRYDKLIPGQFAFHYDTTQLRDSIDKISPSDDIDMTVKVHGTSVIISNTLVRRQLSLWEKVKKFFGFEIDDTKYDIIYSSRKVIKNRYYNPSEPGSFYDTDIHGCCARDFAQFLTPGMTVYGEIAGYCEGQNKFIQKNHDYGCMPGQWKFMPYRITITDRKGNVVEWEVMKVIDWTNNLISLCEQEHPELVNKLMPMTLLYHGRAGDMYGNLYAHVAEELSMEDYEAEVKQFKAEGIELPERLSTPEAYVIHQWRTAWMDAMQKDRKMIGMELREPMCKNDVPREGIVIRKVGDPKPEAFKLKSMAHFHLEMMQHDAGEVDMEEI